MSPASPQIDDAGVGSDHARRGTLTDVGEHHRALEPDHAGAGAGTVEFRLYGPDDATCATAIFTSSNRPLTFSGAGNTNASATSAAFTPTAAGTYRWRAFFSGDANNNAISGAVQRAERVGHREPGDTRDRRRRRRARSRSARGR